MQNTTRTQRMQWMDFMRGAAIVLVILYHSSAILDLFDQPTPGWLVAANNSLGPYRMPALMFLSGLLLPRSLSKPTPVYLWGKVRAAGWPFVVWTVVYALVVGIDANWYSPTFWIASSYLWFLQFVFVFYLVAPLLRRVPGPVLVLIPLLVSLLLEDNSVGQRLAFLAGFFFLGDYIARHPGWLDRFLSSRLAYLLAIPAVGFAVASAMFGPFKYYAEYSLFTIAGIASAVKIAQLAANAGWARPVNYVGRNSIKFYTTHFPAVVLTFHAVLLTELLPVGGAIVVAFLVALLVGWAATYLSSVSYVRYLFELPAWTGNRRSQPTHGRHMRTLSR